MKSIKTLFALGIAVAFSQSSFAETNPLNAVKSATKEASTTQMTQKVNQTKQAVTSVQNSAKSAVTTKAVESKNAANTAVTATKEKAVNTISTSKANLTSAQEKMTTAKETMAQTTKTARDTLNVAKTTATEKATTTSVKVTTAKKGKININTADVETLQALDGIGEAKAKAIVEYRKKHGNFKKAADLTKVSGIGEATLNNIKSSISIQ